MPDVGERDKQALCTVTITLAQPPGFCSSRRSAFFSYFIECIIHKKTNKLDSVGHILWDICVKI